MTAKIKVGSRVPDFSLPSVGGGGETKLSELRGKKIVLFFYPKDDTPGCTAEACGFRDELSKFTEAGAEVIGISKDSINSHTKFKNKYSLPFTLLSDENGVVCKIFNTWVEKSMYGRKYMGIDRATFLIDEEGKLLTEWRKVKVPGHVDEVLKVLLGS